MLKRSRTFYSLKKKKRAQHFNVKHRILEGKVNLTFYSAKKKKGAQLSFNEIIDGKIQVCIAYKTYATDKLTDLLYSQLITCTM